MVDDASTVPRPDPALAAAFRRWRGTHTPEHVAVAAGVSRATVYAWETGDTEPRLSQLLAMEAWKPGLLVELGLRETA